MVKIDVWNHSQKLEVVFSGDYFLVGSHEDASIWAIALLLLHKFLHFPLDYFFYIELFLLMHLSISRLFFIRILFWGLEFVFGFFVCLALELIVLCRALSLSCLLLGWSNLQRIFYGSLAIIKDLRLIFVMFESMRSWISCLSLVRYSVGLALGRVLVSI